MNQSSTQPLSYPPPRRRGLIFHGVVIVVLGGASVLTFITGLNQQVGGYFVLLLVISLLIFAPLPWMIYSAYALSRAAYRIERDGLRLRWGLRAEDIPLPDVEWVRRSNDLAADLPLPPLRWPGAVIGTVHARDLGKVEFLAANTQNLLLIATPRRVYAITPEDTEAFLRGFNRSLEMGSLTPLSSVSVLPAAYLAQVWSERVARWLLAAGFVLTLLLFAAVSLFVPSLQTVSLGFYPDGAPLPGGPSAQLLLLPILQIFIFLTNLATGLFFFRRPNERSIAYIVWGSTVVTSLLLSAAVLFILIYTAQ